MLDERRIHKVPTRTRRQFLENALILGGGVSIVGPAADYFASSLGVLDQVNSEIPYILNSKRIPLIHGTIERLSTLNSRTPDQQAALESAQTLVDIHPKNEELRAQKASQLRHESDEAPVIGSVKRGSLRLWAGGLGTIAFVVSAGSQIARAFGK